MNTWCPHCGKVFEVDEAYKDQNTDCIYCGKIFVAKEMSKSKIPSNLFTSTPKGKLGLEPETKDGFKTPILTMIYRGIAISCILAAIVFLILCLICLRNNIKAVPLLLIATVCSIGAAVVNFGIAQIITSIVKTSYNTDKIVELLRNRLK